MASRAKAPRPRVKKIRRIVTGHDRRGRSRIVSDRASPHVMAIRGIPTFGVTDLWKTLSAPADNSDARDPCSMPIQLAPPAGGSVLRIVEFPPDKAWASKVDREKAFASLGKSAAQALARDASAARHPMMHRTKSVDYAIVLSGEIWALMDVGETRMKAGDVLIQRGTNHAWSNRSSRPCLVAFVLIDAEPLRGLEAH
jgi:quercetin dioxygenase-like cupin family protein